MAEAPPVSSVSQSQEIFSFRSDERDSSHAMTPAFASDSQGRQQVQAILKQVAASASLDRSTDAEFSILYNLVAAYPSKPLMARLAMRELLKRNPRRFCAATLRMLRSSVAGPGMVHLVGLFLDNHLMTRALADPNLLAEDEAVRIAGQLRRIDARLDLKLLNQVMVEELQGARGDTEGIRRALAIIGEISDCVMLVHPLAKLLRHPDAYVRSKAGLLMVRAHRNADWLQQQMMRADPRTLANLIEGLIKAAPTEKEIHLLWTYTYHPNHRVASTALLVLYRNGRPQARERLLEMAKHPSERFRTAAAWAMGQTGDPGFLTVLQHMARNDAGNARRMGLKASVRLRKAMVGAAGTPEVEPAERPVEKGVAEEAVATAEN